MNTARLRRTLRTILPLLLLLLLLPGCGGDSNSAILNTDPAGNDLNEVIAFGDSLTAGTACDCPPYPAQLAGLIGKTVYNEGRGASKATASIDLTQTVIRRHQSAYMLILYGVNDVIHSYSTSSILNAIDQMIQICIDNHVLPVLATYPVPFASHKYFAAGTVRLNQGIRELAAARGLRCVDLEYEFSTGRNPENPDLPQPDESLYDPDGLHPNDAGTTVIALAFADLF